MFRYKKKGEMILQIFPNVSEFYKYVKSTPRRKGAKKESEDTGRSFAYTDTLEEAYDLLLKTDDKLYKKYQNTKKIDIEKILGNRINRKKFKDDIVGFTPNVPNYIRGVPLNMINEIPKNISQKCLNIFINIDVSAFVDTSEMLKAGTLYIQIIDLLEKTGYRCNVYTGITVDGNSGEIGVCYFKIKTDREPFNIKKCIFPLSNPAMFRRIFFKWIECTEFDNELTKNGYGAPLRDEQRTKEIIGKHLKTNAIVWNFQTMKGISEDKIIEKLEKDYGIKIGDDTN